MSKYKQAQRLLGSALIAMLVAGCGLIPGADDDAANKGSSMATKVRGAALAKLCEQGVACEADQVDHALQALGTMLDAMPEQGELMQLVSDDGDSPPSAAGVDMAGLMEMVKAMAGNDAFGDGDGDGDVDVDVDVIAAMEAMQPGSDVANQAPAGTGSATGAELMAGLGGIPVQTGKLTLGELREQLLTPSGEE